MIDQNLLDEIVARLQQTKPLKMFLFGSQATGAANNNVAPDIAHMLTQTVLFFDYVCVAVNVQKSTTSVIDLL